MNQAALTKLTRARTAMILDEPFLGSLALRLAFVEDNSIPTLAVDGKTVFYNAAFVNSLSHSLTKAAVAHEVGHCIFQHIGRRGARAPGKWNRAADYVNNDMIKQAGFTLGENWLHDLSFAGMNADSIYNLLPDEAPKTGEAGGALCDVRDGDEHVTPELSDQMTRDWKIATIQAATAARHAGKLPASMERFIDALVKPKVNWKERLHNFLSEIAKNDYDWARPNKKMLPYGLFMPSLYSETAGTIAVFIDTSGSIDSKTLNAFGAEIQAIREEVRPSETHLIYCDAQVNSAYVLSDEDACTLTMHGGGGTDFKPPFKYLEKRNIEPKCAVYLTDGYGPFPDEADIPYPVLWVMTSDVIAPFGETIPIEVNV